MDDQPIGRRVAYWRVRRKMSQQLFADRLGKSKSWVDKIERGVRQLDRFSVIYEIADVLQLDAQVLLGRDPVRQPENSVCIDQVDVADIRNALERYDKIDSGHSSAAVSVQLADLQKSVDHAWHTFQRCKYGMLARSLPNLLREAQVADAACANDDDAARAAACLLGQVYQASSLTLRKLGEHDLAWFAGDRARTACLRSGDELLLGLATSGVASALVALGRLRPALEMHLDNVNRIAAGVIHDATPARLSVYGVLLLQAAMAAARMGDHAGVRELLSAAEEAAKQVGGDENHYWTAFGPTNVAMHRAAADVELGEGAHAIEVHAGIDPQYFAAMVPERRACHLLDISRAFAQIGDVVRASETLMEASRIGPNEIRCRPVAHELIADLLRRTRAMPSPAVQDLADHLGLSA